MEQILIFNLVAAFASEERSCAWTEHKNKNERNEWKQKMTVQHIVAHFNIGKIQGRSIRHTKSPLGNKEPITKL